MAGVTSFDVAEIGVHSSDVAEAGVTSSDVAEVCVSLPTTGRSDDMVWQANNGCCYRSTNPKPVPILCVPVTHTVC